MGSAVSSSSRELDKFWFRNQVPSGSSMIAAVLPFIFSKFVISGCGFLQAAKASNNSKQQIDAILYFMFRFLLRDNCDRMWSIYLSRPHMINSKVMVIHIIEILVSYFTIRSYSCHQVIGNVAIKSVVSFKVRILNGFLLKLFLKLKLLFIIILFGIFMKIIIIY